jgi:hypothetical protein
VAVLAVTVQMQQMRKLVVRVAVRMTVAVCLVRLAQSIKVSVAQIMLQKLVAVAVQVRQQILQTVVTVLPQRSLAVQFITAVVVVV